MQQIIAYSIIFISFLVAISYIVKSIVMIFSKKPAECACCKNYTCRANQKKN